jgi:hypothetical protein
MCEYEYVAFINNNNVFLFIMLFYKYSLSWIQFVQFLF